MKKKFSAVTALTLTLAMVLTACSGGGGGETTAAAGGDTKAAGETTQAAAPSGDAVKMTMGTGGTTGTYYAFGGVIANVLNAKDIGVNINVQSTGASKANIYLVNDGEADLAIVQNDVMDYAYNGTDLFAEEGAATEFATVAGLYAEVCQVVSTGGQIMPPIMGAAAFLMAEMVGVQYSEIAMRAIFPALLYFTGIFITVHLEAKRLGLKGIAKEDLPKFVPLFIRQGYLLIPLVTLVAMVMMGYTMSRSAVIATLLAILVSIPNKSTRMNPTRFVNALETGGKNTLSVAVACGIAGIIAGVVTMTGLGQILISAIVSVAGDRVIIALFLTMLTCIVLGMGVPTTANYIIMATTCAPILVNGMGINKIAANMFVFYFGIVADITPPVALAAYAGSAIAKSNPMKTALNASRLAIAAFIVPYIFAFNPAMLFIDADVVQVVIIIVTSLVGLTGVAGGLEGYMVTNMNPIQRILAVVGGLCLIIPGTVTDLAGIAIVGASVVWQLADKKKRAAA